MPDPLNDIGALQKRVESVLERLGWEILPHSFKISSQGFLEFRCIKEEKDEIVTLDYHKSNDFEDVLKGLL